MTRVKQVEHRLEDTNDGEVNNSGSAVEFVDGHNVLDYEQIPTLDRSRPGDPVRLCVVHLPTHCPAGDTRGIRYRFTNLHSGRTAQRLLDSEHICGGA